MESPENMSANDNSEQTSWVELRELFHRALELPSEAWSEFLDGACAKRPALRAELEEMLAATDRDQALRIETRLFGWEDEESASERRRVGKYRLRRLLGRGGMGEVYLADREDAFEQRVAVKIMRPGLFGSDLVRRFQEEQQILARLTHPLIVPLLDGGVTEDGRPYLVMQYVEGRPISEYCVAERLPIPKRLELLSGVCRAVQYAHSNLVVHRDLKPSNILVTAEGEPLLLDFGIAKLLQPETGQPAEVTQAQLTWITPERAAPEQRRGEPASTATDVYALGVLLFELLVDRLPFERGAAAPHGPADPPPAPSAAVKPRMASGSKERRSLRELQRGLRGDLDRIVQKALAPDPEDRYPSAGHLGDELERFLTGRPIQAQPDRWRYRAAKFVRRHAAAVVAASLAVVLLLAFSVTSMLQARRIASESERANETLDVLVGLFETTDPSVRSGSQALAVDDFLEEGHRRIEQLENQPELQARLEHVLGRIYLKRSMYKQARSILESAAGRQAAPPGDELTVQLEIDLARALERTSDLKASEALLRKNLPRLRRVFGEDHPLTTQTLIRLGRLVGGSEGEELASQALVLERARTEPDLESLGRALAGVAEHRAREGDLRAAETLFTEAAEIFVSLKGEDHPATQTTLTNLAFVMQDYEQQVKLNLRVIEIGRRVYGPETAPVANRLNNLGALYRDHGELDKAESTLREAAAIWEQVGAPRHWRTARVWSNLARVYELQGRHEDALALTERALAMARVASGTDPRLLGTILTQSGRLLSAASSHEAAIAAAREAVGLLEPPSGTPPSLAGAYLTLGQALLAGGSAEEAEPALRKALGLRRSHMADDPQRLGEASCALGNALATLGRRTEARPLLESGLEAVEDWPAATPGELEACRRALDG